MTNAVHRVPDEPLTAGTFADEYAMDSRQAPNHCRDEIEERPTL